MENKKIALAKIKNKIRSTDKKVWIGIGIIGAFVILAVALIIVAIYSSGSSLGEFFVHNAGWFILAIAVLVAIVFTVIFFKVKKGK